MNGCECFDYSVRTRADREHVFATENGPFARLAGAEILNDRTHFQVVRNCHSVEAEIVA
jgi:hypothetical protein